MQIDLPPEMETFIQGKVAGGSYDNATEVIRDALRRMQADEARSQAWLAAIRQGDDELDRGEGVPYSADALDDITEAALRDMNSGKRADPDGREHGSAIAVVRILHQRMSLSAQV